MEEIRGMVTPGHSLETIIQYVTNQERAMVVYRPRGLRLSSRMWEREAGQESEDQWMDIDSEKEMKGCEFDVTSQLPNCIHESSHATAKKVDERTEESSKSVDGSPFSIREADSPIRDFEDDTETKSREGNSVEILDLTFTTPETQVGAEIRIEKEVEVVFVSKNEELRASRKRRFGDDVSSVNQKTRRTTRAGTPTQPTVPDYDQNVFSLLDAYRRYKLYSSSSERFIEKHAYTFDDQESELVQLLKDVGLFESLDNVVDYSTDVLYELWANMPYHEQESESWTVFLRGYEYIVSAEKINEVLGSPNVVDRSNPQKLKGVLSEDIAEIVTGGVVKNLNRVNKAHLDKLYSQLYTFCCTNWLPTSNEGYVSILRLQLAYKIGTRTPLNLGKVIFSQIKKVAASTRESKSKLYLLYLSLLTRLLANQHEVPVAVNTVSSVRPKVKKQKGKAKASVTEESYTTKELLETILVMSEEITHLCKNVLKGGVKLQESDQECVDLSD